MQGRTYVGLSSQQTFEARLREFESRPPVERDEDVASTLACWERWIDVCAQSGGVPITATAADRLARVRRITQHMRGVSLDGGGSASSSSASSKSGATAAADGASPTATAAAAASSSGHDAAASPAAVALTVAMRDIMKHAHGAILRRTDGVIDLRSRRKFDAAHFPHTTSIAWTTGDSSGSDTTSTSNTGDAHDAAAASGTAPGCDGGGTPGAGDGGGGGNGGDDDNDDALSFQDRAHELPARGSSLALLSDARGSLNAAAALLLRRGYTVSLVLLASPAAFAKAGAAGAGAVASALHTPTTPWQPSSRQLWQPSSCLRELLPAAEAALVPAFEAGGDALALDLGCGGGRESMLLLQRGWRVFAVDIHDDTRFRTILASLGGAPAAWGKSFEERCVYRQLDLESPAGLQALMHGPPLYAAAADESVTGGDAITDSGGRGDGSGDGSGDGAEVPALPEASETNTDGASGAVVVGDADGSAVLEGGSTARAAAASTATPSAATDGSAGTAVDVQAAEGEGEAGASTVAAVADTVTVPARRRGAQLVWVGRFLHRPLLAVIRDHIVAPGGVVVYHTFCKGCERFGRPKKERYLLRAGELAAVFAGWRIVVDEIRPISDGRPCSFFCAVKPGAAAAATAVATGQQW